MRRDILGVAKPDDVSVTGVTGAVFWRPYGY